ncbi:VCBS repeat-containing protein [bacterium]|nr:VCBS repeat-containing protein [bacterium]
MKSAGVYWLLVFIILIPLWGEFVCYTGSAGLDVFCSTSGVQVGDINGDGLFDLMFTARDFGIFLFIADSPFHFNESDWSLPTLGYTRGATLLDIDNDSTLDMFVAFLYSPTLLFRNNGSSFVDITSLWGLDVPDQGEGTACLDYNRDGKIDIFVGRYHAVKNLFHNNGASLTDVTSAAGFDDILDGNDLPSVADFDGNRWTDISISGNENYIRLFHNNGDGTFSDTCISTDFNTGGHDWADFDNDGDMDLAVIGEDRPYIFKNNGGTFVEVGESLGIAETYAGLGGCNWGDYDNDGWVDLLITQTSESFLYRNIYGTNFENVTSIEGLDTISNACGAAFADFDEDGFLDIAVSRWEDGPKSVLKNQRANNYSWIEIDLEGAESPRNPVGTEVSVFIDTMRFTRQVGSNHGYASQNPYRIHFGLGYVRPAVIDSIVINWTSGRRDTYRSVVPNHIYSFIEDTASIYENNSGSRGKNMFYVIGKTIVLNSHTKGTIQVFDIMGRLILSKELSGKFSGNKIELSKCPAGVYFLKLNNNGNDKTIKKVVILK